MARTTQTSKSRTPAEQARDVLARASSAHVTWLDLPDRPQGRIPGLLLDDSPTCGHLAPAGVEIADPAPVPTCDRIRARLRVHGHAAFDGEPLRMRPLAAVLVVDGAETPVDLDELRTATPDPFALTEAALLSHLASGHPSELAAMRRLLPQGLRERPVTPLALDAGGLTLRAMLPEGHVDVRLPFSRPISDGRQLRAELQALVDRARRPRVADLMRSGPAAARICRPEAG